MNQVIEIGKKAFKTIIYLFIGVVFFIVIFQIALYTIFPRLESAQLKNYYSKKEVYVTVSGEVEYFKVLWKKHLVLNGVPSIGLL